MMNNVYNSNNPNIQRIINLALNNGNNSFPQTPINPVDNIMNRATGGSSFGQTPTPYANNDIELNNVTKTESNPLISDSFKSRISDIGSNINKFIGNPMFIPMTAGGSIGNYLNSKFNNSNNDNLQPTTLSNYQPMNMLPSNDNNINPTNNIMNMAGLSNQPEIISYNTPSISPSINKAPVEDKKWYNKAGGAGLIGTGVSALATLLAGGSGAEALAYGAYGGGKAVDSFNNQEQMAIDNDNTNKNQERADRNLLRQEDATNRQLNIAERRLELDRQRTLLNEGLSGKDNSVQIENIDRARAGIEDLKRIAGDGDIGAFTRGKANYGIASNKQQQDLGKLSASIASIAPLAIQRLKDSGVSGVNTLGEFMTYVGLPENATSEQIKGAIPRIENTLGLNNKQGNDPLGIL